jgi:hypothetical protein
VKILVCNTAGRSLLPRLHNREGRQATWVMRPDRSRYVRLFARCPRAKRGVPRLARCRQEQRHGAALAVWAWIAGRIT